jgi:hypothetical protein
LGSNSQSSKSINRSRQAIRSGTQQGSHSSAVGRPRGQRCRQT